MPPAQTKPQAPTEQTCSAEQALPQAPQFAGSFVVLTQVSPHAVSFGPQLHLPAAQL
ncbi:MAG TPA: hypothetical protein VEQ59_14955 [Polyangiaceae bacterium]|nr:hypothetical protein [Polyangiaceae bacterium]